MYYLDSRRFQKIAQSVTELDFVSIVYNLSIKVEIRAPPEGTFVKEMKYHFLLFSFTRATYIDKYKAPQIASTPNLSQIGFSLLLGPFFHSLLNA